MRAWVRSLVSMTVVLSSGFHGIVFSLVCVVAGRLRLAQSVRHVAMADLSVGYGLALPAGAECLAPPKHRRWKIVTKPYAGGDAQQQERDAGSEQAPSVCV